VVELVGSFGRHVKKAHKFLPAGFGSKNHLESRHFISKNNKKTKNPARLSPGHNLSRTYKSKNARFGSNSQFVRRRFLALLLIRLPFARFGSGGHAMQPFFSLIHR
jgi:hypothetical protein